MHICAGHFFGEKKIFLGDNDFAFINRNATINKDFPGYGKFSLKSKKQTKINISFATTIYFIVEYVFLLL